MGQTYDVQIVAEQVTETHRTLENDRTVTEVELPGVFNVYYVIGGGRVLIDQLKGGVVPDAIETAKQNQAAQDTSTGDPSQPSQPTEPQPQPQV